MTKNKRKEAQFTKAQLIGAKVPVGNVDLMNCILSNEKTYSKSDVLRLMREFFERKV